MTVGKPSASNISLQAGFTIVEMAVVMVLLGIAVAWAVPSYRTATANADLRGVTMDFVSVLNNARAEAVHARNVVLLESLSGDGQWGDDGWRLVHPREGDFDYGVRGKVTVREINDVASATFRPDGLVVDGDGAPVSLVFRICDDRDSEAGRQISVNRFGRVENTTPADRTGCQ